MKTSFILIALLVICFSVASANDQACSSLNNLPLAKAAKARALKDCVSALQERQQNSTTFSSLDRGEYISMDVTSDPMACGFPSRFVSMQVGSQRHTDSDGNDFGGTLVFISLQDYDCSGNLLVNTTGENDFLPPEASEINAFSGAVITVDVDVDFMDGVTRHVTANLNGTGQGFINSDKIRNTFKRETYNESTNLAQKFRDTVFTGNLTFDSDSYVLTNGIILKFKLAFKHEDF